MVILTAPLAATVTAPSGRSNCLVWPFVRVMVYRVGTSVMSLSVISLIVGACHEGRSEDRGDTVAQLVSFECWRDQPSRRLLLQVGLETASSPLCAERVPTSTRPKFHP